MGLNIQKLQQTLLNVESANFEKCFEKALNTELVEKEF